MGGSRRNQNQWRMLLGEQSGSCRCHFSQVTPLLVSLAHAQALGECETLWHAWSDKACGTPTGGINGLDFRGKVFLRTVTQNWVLWYTCVPICGLYNGTFRTPTFGFL